MQTSTEPSTSNGFIPLSVPEIAGNEWAYIKECLDTNWVSAVGPFVDRFERVVAEYIGVEYGVATINGTAALHTALLLAGVQPEDEVIVSSLSFIAPANAIRYIGARPVFMDAEPEYWQMDTQKVLDFLDKECRWANGELHNRKSGRTVRAIIPVHILGHPVDMRPIIEAVEKYNLFIIEDAAESLGARYRDSRVGNFGHIACLSFNGNKTITTGSGGMIVMNDEEIARRARYLTTQAKDDPIEYYHDEVGYNYRPSNILAAMGVAQMESLDKYITKKRAIAAKYTAAFKNIEGITTFREADWAFGTYWMYTILIDDEVCRINSRAVIQRLGESGIQSRPLWRPLPGNKPFRDCQAYKVEVANRLHQRAVSLPSSAGLTDEQQDRVIRILIDILRR